MTEDFYSKLYELKEFHGLDMARWIRETLEPELEKAWAGAVGGEKQG